MEPVAVSGSFGWFAAGRTRRGVILCGTYGFEQHSAHRWWRELAEALAAAGCSVLRFDYPGEGDSTGSAPGLETSLDAIRHAVRAMREDAGAEEIVLVGLRLGGTFAALAAAACGIDRLVLLAPFARGRAYLREMEIQARVIDIDPEGGPLPARPGVLTVGGFPLGPELIADLARIDLLAGDRPPAPRILILGPDPAGLAACYAAAGSEVETGDLPGLSTLVVDVMSPRMQEEPRARILAFASDGATAHAVRRRLPRTVEGTIAGAGWSEAPVRFGEGLFGIRCRARNALPGTPTVLFVNMGANVHSGYGRQTTNLARALARSGVTSLRFDLGGVGDSVDRPDGALPLYKLDAVADVRAAVEALARTEGRPVIAVGTCNGAYLAFHALCQDHRIAGAVLVNLYCFDWDLTHGGVPYGEKPVRHAAAYLALLTDRAAWRRILGGTTPIGTIIGTMAKRGLKRLAARCGRRSAPGQPLSIPDRIAAVRARGARLALLYCTGDLGLVDLRSQVGSLEHAETILGQPVRIVPGTNHFFASEAAQDALRRELLAMSAACAVARPRVAGAAIAAASGPSLNVA